MSLMYACDWWAYVGGGGWEDKVRPQAEYKRYYYAKGVTG